MGHLLTAFGHLERSLKRKACPGYPGVRASPPITPFSRCARMAGGKANSPISFGISALPGHHEQRSPSTSMPTRRQRVTIDLSEIDRVAGSEDVEPRVAGEQRRPDR
jgi:hypothetical protein